MVKPVFHSVQSQTVNTQKIRPIKPDRLNKPSFGMHFQNAIHSNNKLVVSKHAKERLGQRGIDINNESWKRIEEKIHEAKKMGVKESLVLLKDVALIVSAKNNTVITAMNREEASSQIFTNINGTIILE
ncbi:TIGR02530 family flagellar biosynthesis protein [Bacillus sp. 31A1R]|uniref:TIGR02530 family flagellar biosynthesis protein n=1 Tax=Robertmurraya mangrovi TaxID=3098077 RepID=A0ABU5J290_9BACI|nr:TIGR02530 family flagellar biosynthesis protein [Bacillus sp. 31A1R]MDZ5473477.1 TIGR02530 family flagellar biosynthesis protein [Bacillus sp. 31A1R]